jgi:ribosomal protein L27
VRAADLLPTGVIVQDDRIGMVDRPQIHPADKVGKGSVHSVFALWVKQNRVSFDFLHSI